MRKLFEAEFDNLCFRIEEDDPEVGAYLYVFTGGNCIRDYLQNSVHDCRQFAFDEYGVPVGTWYEVKNS